MIIKNAKQLDVSKQGILMVPREGKKTMLRSRAEASVVTQMQRTWHRSMQTDQKLDVAMHKVQSAPFHLPLWARAAFSTGSR